MQHTTLHLILESAIFHSRLPHFALPQQPASFCNIVFVLTPRAKFLVLFPPQDEILFFKILKTFLFHKFLAFSDVLSA